MLIINEPVNAKRVKIKLNIFSPFFLEFAKNKITSMAKSNTVIVPNGFMNVLMLFIKSIYSSPSQSFILK